VASAAVLYRAAMTPAGPHELLDRTVPDLTLPATTGGDFALRSRINVGPLALFFFIRSGTPG